jgi:hypothetical protein
MSNSTKPETKAFCPDFLHPIARGGEEQFCCILRNRSGESAGRIDYGLRDISSLSSAEQQDAVSSIYFAYRSWVESTGKVATYSDGSTADIGHVAHTRNMAANARSS